MEQFRETSKSLTFGLPAKAGTQKSGELDVGPESGSGGTILRGSLLAWDSLREQAMMSFTLVQRAFSKFRVGRICLFVDFPPVTMESRIAPDRRTSTTVRLMTSTFLSLLT